MDQRVNNSVQMLENFNKNNPNTRHCWIYKITSKTTKLSYIGQTTQKNIRDRFGKNGYRYLRSHNKELTTKFANAIRELGWEDFEYEVLEICSIYDKEQREKFWIKYFDTVNNGYNSDDGGTIGQVQSIESKQKRSKALLGHPVSEETRQKLSEFRKSCIGKHTHTNETKNKMSVSNARNHSVMCIDTYNNETHIFRSIKQLCLAHSDWKYPTIVDVVKYKRLYKGRYKIVSICEE